MIHHPAKFDPPLIILSSVPLSFFIFKMAKMFYIYRSRVKATVIQTMASALAGLSLSHTIAKAVMFGFFTKSLPFFRTPKIVKGRAIRHALQSAREEGLFAMALILAAHRIITQQGSETPDVLVWIIVLLVQSIPYLASIIMSLISVFAPFPDMLIENLTASPVKNSSADTGELENEGPPHVSP